MTNLNSPAPNYGPDLLKVHGWAIATIRELGLEVPEDASLSDRLQAIRLSALAVKEAADYTLLHRAKYCGLTEAEYLELSRG